MWSLQCHVEFGYQLNIRSRAKENQGNSWSNWKVAEPPECKLTSSQQSDIWYTNPNASLYLRVALFWNLYRFVGHKKCVWGWVVRDITFKEGREIFSALKVSMQCPLVLLSRLRLKENRALGSEEGKGLWCRHSYEQRAETGLYCVWSEIILTSKLEGLH